MPLLDFDSLVICNHDTSVSSLNDTLVHFTKLGIRKFIITYELDPHTSSMYDMLNNYKQFKTRISAIKPRGVKLRVVPEVYLHQSTLKNPFIKRFKLPRTNLLFVRAPIFNDKDWLPQDINYLLYKQKLKPVLCSFETNLDTCNSRDMEQLYKTQNVIHCMDINFLTSVTSEEQLRMLTKLEIPVLPCITKELCYYQNALVRYDHLRDRIGDKRYLRLCKHLNQSVRSILSFF